MSENLNSAIVNMLEEDSLKDYIERLSVEKRTRIANSLKHVKTGLYAVAPITCGGPHKCPFISHCPIPSISSLGQIDLGPNSDYPINRSCILEATYIRQKTIEYITYLKVDAENPVEMGLVNELALIDLYKNRTAMILSSGDKTGQGQDFLKIDITGFSDNGNGRPQRGEDYESDSGSQVSTSTQLHPALLLIDQLEKRRNKILSDLVQTRKAQTEISIKMGKNREESQLIVELKQVKEMLAKQQTQVHQLTKHDDELMPIKD